MINPFFKNNGPFKISDILQQINLDDFKIDNDQEINDIKGRRAKRRRWGRREEPGRERGDRAKTRCPGGERHGDDPVDTNAAMNAGGGAKGTI